MPALWRCSETTDERELKKANTIEDHRLPIWRASVFVTARSLQRVVILALLAIAAPASSLAQGAMPPGMTPKIMKMMMTPGPAHPAGLPKSVVPFMGCIPAMGYHYIKPGSTASGPYYGYYAGKPTFTEIMLSKTAFANGESWDDALKPLPGYKIDHVDIWWEPHGHPGYLVPHYDIHAWYVPHAEHMTYCGNTSGKKPAFV
jgi:hypothetical protein